MVLQIRNPIGGCAGKYCSSNPGQGNVLYSKVLLRSSYIRDLPDDVYTSSVMIISP